MADRQIWKGRGHLTYPGGVVVFDQEIPEQALKHLDSGRIAALKAAGKIGNRTVAEETARREQAAAKARAGRTAADDSKKK